MKEESNPTIVTNANTALVDKVKEMDTIELEENKEEI